ncbi:MAG: serine/threonine-protein kinase [Magnetococcus sp. YQC-5]
MGTIGDEALPVDFELHHYQIKKVLGRGGFGITYLARDPMLEMDVVIKELYPKFMGVARNRSHAVVVPDSANKDVFQQSMERFVEEGRHIARFHNESIVRILSFFQENGTAYLVMEYMEGETLYAKYQKGACRSEADLMRIVRPLMKALQLLHNEGLVHRDVKPGNIYIRKDGSPMLLDFGAARQYISDLTGNLTSLLTPGYAPLEQYSGKKSEHGPWTDIYSLAAVLYAGVVGHPPIDVIARSNALLHDGKDPLVLAMTVGKERYSRHFLGAIDTALRIGHAERPKNMDEWLHCFRLGNFERKVVTSEDSEKNRAYIAKAVKTISFFAGFTDEEQQRFFANHTRIQKCTSGVYIIKEGSMDACFYILLSGSVIVLKNGNPSPLSELGPGAIFGEISFLTNTPRTANVISNDACLLVQVDKELMITLGSDIREKIKDRIIGQLLKRMTKMNQILHNVVKASYVLMGTHVNMEMGEENMDDVGV